MFINKQNHLRNKLDTIIPGLGSSGFRNLEMVCLLGCRTINLDLQITTTTNHQIILPTILWTGNHRTRIGRDRRRRTKRWNVHTRSRRKSRWSPRGWWIGMTRRLWDREWRGLDMRGQLRVKRSRRHYEGRMRWGWRGNSGRRRGNSRS